jgi:D-serine dehydratase
MREFLAGSSVSERLKRTGASLLDKGIPFGFDFDSAIESRINILAGGLHFPLLVLKEAALAYNLAAMAEWCAANNFLIAPHGKTTMTPRIFERQMEAGAWAITVATVSQAAICAEMGIKRVLIANQVVGRANLRSLAAMMKADPTLDVLCLVDSSEGIEFLTSEWQAAGTNRCLGVLVEMGRQGWRTGARSVESALELCAEILRHPQTLRLRGIEGFEGLAHAPEPQEEVGQVRQFFANVATLGKEVQSLHQAGKEPLLLSIGGSSFLDAVGEVGQQMRGDFQIVIRSGCYVTHDHGYYAQ